MGVTLPIIASQLAHDPASQFLVQAIGMIAAPVFALTAPLAGTIVARHGERAVLLGGLALFLVGGMLPFWLNNLWTILVCRVILALGVAAGFTAGMSGIARLPVRQRNVLFGMNTFAGGVLVILIYPIIGRLAAIDWHLAVLVHGVLAPVFLLALALPRRVSQSASTPSAQRSVAASQFAAGLPVLLLAIVAFVGWVMVSSSIFSPFYLTSIGIADPSRIGEILSAAGICALIGSGGYSIAQRWFETRTMLVFGLATMLASCLSLSLLPNPHMVVIELGLLSVGLTTFSPAVYSLATSIVGAASNRGKAVGVTSAMLYGPQILFPLFASTLTSFGGPKTVYFGLAVLMLISLTILPLTAPRPEPAIAQ
jgi:MFS family permease